MTAPLTPDDCDLRDFQFMPLDIVRLFGSRFHAVANDAEWRAGVTLWLKSFHQVPAGSVPNDDTELCRLAELGRDLRTWRKVKANALHGWVLCDDDRYYHPVVCEKAIEAWTKRVSYRERGRKGNEKRWNSDGSRDRDSEDGATAQGSQTDRLAIAAASQGTGTGREIVDSVSDETAVDPLIELRALPIATGAWRLALKVLMERGGKSDPNARSLCGLWRKHGLTPEDLWPIAERTWLNGTPDPVGYMTKQVEAAVQRAADPSIMAPGERQQRAWMEDWRDHPNAWRSYERGPKPGEIGCRVSSAILAEFGVEPADVAA